jgi:hypothetical protein
MVGQVSRASCFFASVSRLRSPLPSGFRHFTRFAANRDRTPCLYVLTEILQLNLTTSFFGLMDLWNIIIQVLPLPDFHALS